MTFKHARSEAAHQESLATHSVTSAGCRAYAQGDKKIWQQGLKPKSIEKLHVPAGHPQDCHSPSAERKELGE